MASNASFPYDTHLRIQGEDWISRWKAETEDADADAHERIVALEEKANQHFHVIMMLHDKVTQLATEFRLLVEEVSRLSEEVLTQKSQIAAMPSTATASQNQPPPPFPAASHPSPHQPPVALFDSRIICRGFKEIRRIGASSTLMRAREKLAHGNDTIDSFPMFILPQR
jgi:uncharacterized coiled-coil protein SlyX